MPRDPIWRRYLRFWRPDVAADVDDEIGFHLEERVADLVARGVAPEAARAQARAEFGDVEAVRAHLRALGDRRERRRGWAERVETVRSDAAYAARGLSRAPGLAVTVVVTLALGLGANGAIFGLVDRLFLRPPSAVADPGGVRRIYVTSRQRTGETFTRAPVTYPEFLDLQTAAGQDARLTVYNADERRLGRGAGAERVGVVYAGAGYFDVLGVRPAVGRFFGPDEQRIEVAAPVAVLSDRLWRRRFGGDPAVLGRTVELGRDRFTVVGVAPPRFVGTDLGAADLWLPLSTLPAPDGGTRAWYQSRRLYMLRVLARPAPGADVRQLAARSTAALRRGSAGDPHAMREMVVSTGPIIAARGPETPTKEASIAVRLAGVALVVLLVACANVANLLLARGIQRRREIAVRVALGIRGARLRAMLLTEAVLLALLGGGAALLAALWGGAALRAWLLPDVRWDGPALDARDAAFLGAAALLTGLLAGLAPAVRASRPDLATALKAGAREGTFQRSRLRTALVLVQAALSVVLLVGAGLFVRSLQNVRALDIGYDTERLVFASPAFEDGSARRAADVAAGLEDVAERLARAPGVERVALTTMTPMRGFSFVEMFLPGRDSLPPGIPPVYTGVSPDYFAAAGIRVVRGRGLTAADRQGAAPALVVNETMARTLWPGAEPLGQCVRFVARANPCFTVVGVVEDARRGEIIEESAMMYYTPLTQPPVPGAGSEASALVLRTPPASAAAVAALARRALAERFPEAEPHLLPMAEVLAPQLRPWRLGATLFSLLGGLALAVAAVGVYSMVAHAAGQRRHEFGVRIALGARAGTVLALVLGEGVRTVAAGVVLGAALALAAGRLVASLLYGVSPRDPAVLAAVAGTLVAAAVVASLVPAWRASRVDPVEALRTE